MPLLVKVFLTIMILLFITFIISWGYHLVGSNKKIQEMCYKIAYVSIYSMFITFFVSLLTLIWGVI